MEESGQLHALAALPSGNTHWLGDWVGSRVILNTVVKRKIPNPRRKSNPRTPFLQSVAQRYSDW
jgi:hypothetical protein